MRIVSQPIDGLPLNEWEACNLIEAGLFIWRDGDKRRGIDYIKMGLGKVGEEA